MKIVTLSFFFVLRLEKKPLCIYSTPQLSNFSGTKSPSFICNTANEILGRLVNIKDLLKRSFI